MSAFDAWGAVRDTGVVVDPDVRGTNYRFELGDVSRNGRETGARSAT